MTNVVQSHSIRPSRLDIGQITLLSQVQQSPIQGFGRNIGELFPATIDELFLELVVEDDFVGTEPVVNRCKNVNDNLFDFLRGYRIEIGLILFLRPNLRIEHASRQSDGEDQDSE